ncbi:MAG: AP2/ERF family transcription factor [Rubripirellula sp.]
MRANRNITRIERLTTGGYLVRVTRRGKLHSAFFSDEEYGKRGSQKAAREYRDELEKKLKGFTSKQLAKKQRSNNTSGVAGVRLVEETDYRWESEPTYQYWVAQWSPKKGVRKTRRFSVEKYGHDEARRLAIKARNKGVNEMES